jgi:hypothetical protein
MGAMKTLSKLSLLCNPLKSEGAIILANVLGRNAMPNLTRLDLSFCGIDADGVVALVSALEQNTCLQILCLRCNRFDERGSVALAESLPNIKGLQQINIVACGGLQSNLPLLLEGFRKNTSLVEVTIDPSGMPVYFIQKINFLGQRNRFTPLLKASDPPDPPLRLGIWSRALAKVATEPDVIFHSLCNKPELVALSANCLNKRKCDDDHHDDSRVE